LPAWSIVDSNWRVASEIVIAVARLTDAVGAADDDVRTKGVAGTEITVGSTGRADELVRGGVVDNLRRGESSRCRDDECLSEHIGCDVVDV
jgi:hypothetical protein